MAVQKRNDEMVNLLSADFIQNRANTVGYQHLFNDFQIKNSIAADQTITIAAGHQRLAWNIFTINGSLTVNGDLVIF